MTIISEQLPAEEVEKGGTQPPDLADRGGAKSVFPLTLVPFERYMLADDRSAYPMTFVVRVELAGTANREAMDAAFADALLRHPLLTARLARRGLTRRWEASGDPPPVLDWHETLASPPFSELQSIDLRKTAGIAGEIHIDEGLTRIFLLMHHAVCDGIGAMRFLGDLLALYGQRTARGDERPRLLPLDSANLAFRGQFDIRVPEPISRWEVIKGTVREVWKVVSRRPLPLRFRRRPATSASAGRLTATWEILPEELFRRYCEAASASEVTVNDLVLRDMFLTLNTWNRQQDTRGSRGWLRVNVPTSLRGKRDSRMPATNVLGYALVTHHSNECERPSQLLSQIASETAAIRAWSLGAMFVGALQVVGRVPGALWVGARLGRRFSTAVLSNLGDPTRRFRARFPRVNNELQAGDLTLKSISGAPPVRPGTRIALALFSYADRLCVGLNADPRWCDEATAREFLDAFECQLRTSINTKLPPASSEAP
jgi:hypothetical protein